MNKSFKELILREAINKTNGRIFGVSFIKKDGSLRDMTARIHVHIGVKGTAPEVTAKRKETLFNNGMIGVYDMNKVPENYENLDDIEKEKIKKGAFRTINLLTVRRFSFQGEEIKFDE